MLALDTLLEILGPEGARQALLKRQEQGQDPGADKVRRLGAALRALEKTTESDPEAVPDQWLTIPGGRLQDTWTKNKE
jgi:hypothetical protein